MEKKFSIFITLWIGYALTYMLRKPLGIIKSDLKDELKFSTMQLGWLDSAFILPYAVIQMLASNLGDTYGSNSILSSSLFMCGLSMISFGMWNDFYILFVLLVFNGIFQSMCWPNVCKILSSWFESNKSYHVFGLIGISGYVGGMASSAMTVYLVKFYGWRSTYLVPSLGMMIIGFIVKKTCHEPTPLIPVQSNRNDGINLMQSFRLFQMPLVPELSISLFCLKFVRYAMYMWLPMYISSHVHLDKTTAGLFSAWFDFGGIFGTLNIGFIIGYIFKGDSLSACTFCCFLSSLMLLSFTFANQVDIWIFSLLISIAGASNCGPDILIGGSIPGKLGKATNNGSGLTGLINGFGTLGSVVQGPIIGFLVSVYGWDVFSKILSFTSFLGSFFCLVTYMKNNKQNIISL